jgi:hypothetical protein
LIASKEDIDSGVYGVEMRAGDRWHNASIEDVLLPSMRIENIKVVAHKQLI